MSKETYPVPGSALKPQNLQYRGEFGANQKEFEEQTFRNANHFTVVRFGTHNGSEAATFESFARAVYEAHQNPRALVYAVTLAGRHFCIPHSEFEKYAQIHFEMQDARKS